METGIDSRLLTAFILVTLALSGTGPLIVQPHIVWERPFSASSVSVAPDGVYAGGSSEVRKYDFNGNLEWIAKVEGIVTGLAAEPAGVYAVGTVARTTSTGFLKPNAILTRIDSRGHSEWVREFDLFPESDGLGSTTGSAVAASGGSVYVVGLTLLGLQYPDYPFVAKLDANGNQVWLTGYRCPWERYCIVVPTGISAGARGVYISGINGCWYHDNLCPFNAFVSALDFNGSFVWTREIVSSCPYVTDPTVNYYFLECTSSIALSKPEDFANGITVAPSGIYVVGAAEGAFPGQVHQSSPRYSFDAFVRKYDLNGTEQWTRQYGSQNGVGVYDSVGVGVGLSAGPSRVYVIGTDGLRYLDTDGNLVGSLSLDFTAHSVSATPSGDIFVAGYSSVAQICASPSCIRR